MKKLTKIFVILFVAITVFASFTGCGTIKEEELADTIWQSNTKYLSSYSCDVFKQIGFTENGTFVELIYSTNGNIVDANEGEWYFENNELCVKIDGTPGYMVFKYDSFGKKLKNGDWTYTMLEEAE